VIFLGSNVIDSQIPSWFIVHDITASTSPDKYGYQRNENIMINYSINCSGNEGGDKYFIFKENKSFHIDDTPGHGPSVSYPDNIGDQNTTPDLFDDTFANEKLKRCKIWIYDNNTRKEISPTIIILNISPTLNCTANTTYDLTSQSFVELKIPHPEKLNRIKSEIRVINKNPEVVSAAIINKDAGPVAKFEVKDEDSRYINLSLCKNEEGLQEYTWSKIKNGNFPIIWNNEFPLNEFDKEEIAFLSLHVVDSDGGDNWGIPSKEKVGQENEYTNFSIFIFFVTLLSFLLFNYFTNSLNFPKFPLISCSFILILLHYIFFEHFFILFYIFILVVFLSNYYLYSLSKYGVKPIISGCDNKAFYLFISHGWIFIVILLLIYYSSKNIIEAEMNSSYIFGILSVLLAILGIVIPIFFADNIKKEKKEIYKWFAILICFIFLCSIPGSVSEIPIKTFIYPIKFIAPILLLIAFALLLGPVFIYLYLDKLQE
jgi:hypothetical protein